MVPVLKQVDVVVVDEWHVLVQQKRGILFELFLSWFADIQPTLKRWALSATLSNPSLAARCWHRVKMWPWFVMTLRR